MFKQKHDFESPHGGTLVDRLETCTAYIVITSKAVNIKNESLRNVLKEIFLKIINVRSNYLEDFSWVKIRKEVKRKIDIEDLRDQGFLTMEYLTTWLFELKDVLESISNVLHKSEIEECESVRLLQVLNYIEEIIPGDLMF